MKKLEVGVIGLGKFGLQVASSLTALGHRIVGLDGNAARVNLAAPTLAAVYQGDATDQELLEQLRFQDLDHVIVSVGDSMETSILVTLNLTELGIKHIIAKAISPIHRKVLHRLGVHRAIQPELDVAVQTAYRLHHPGMLDFLPIGGGVLLQEITINDWAEKNLLELDLISTYQIMVVAIKQAGTTNFQFVPDPKAPLKKGDTLLLIGKPEDVRKLVP